jgi:pSer/pThr/pTyr-binding forkhead associated (FHA) protein
MSLFSEIEKTIERGFRTWTERMFGRAESDDLLLVHRGILEEIESKIQTAQRGRQVFPYNHLTIRLASADPDRRALYQMAFGQEGRLEKDIREALEGARCEMPPNFTVEIETAESGERAYEIDYAMRQQIAPPVHTPAAVARVVVVRGKARQQEYVLEKPRMNVGRLEEITDHEHRVLRRNDIVFEDGADEANATVSRQHAHIRKDGGEYRLSDDGSEYGTRIFREGRPIDVPAGGRRGERLRAGDEIYFGRVCLRFEQ